MAVTAQSVAERCRAAQNAWRVLSTLDGATRNVALHTMADELEARTPDILEANARDMEDGRDGGMSPALLDRLSLDEARVANASTRFTDRGEFGLGAEIGNSTQKLHARGPIALRELCTFKYVVQGDGHIRP